MKARHNFPFFDRNETVLGDYQQVFNLKFSVVYWPPIIDSIKTLEGAVQVSGPMLTMMIEICRKLKLR